jgi:hypothetical protein
LKTVSIRLINPMFSPYFFLLPVNWRGWYFYFFAGGFIRSGAGDFFVRENETLKFIT